MMQFEAPSSAPATKRSRKETPKPAIVTEAQRQAVIEQRPLSRTIDHEPKVVLSPKLEGDIRQAEQTEQELKQYEAYTNQSEEYANKLLVRFEDDFQSREPKNNIDQERAKMIELKRYLEGLQAHGQEMPGNPRLQAARERGFNVIVGLEDAIHRADLLHRMMAIDTNWNVKKPTARRQEEREMRPSPESDKWNKAAEQRKKEVAQEQKKKQSWWKRLWS